MIEIRITPEKGYELHVTKKDSHGADEGEWNVWLNTEVSDYDGLIVGQGPTPGAAMENARATLTKLAAALS
jgi:hypothetical protein